MMDPETTQSDTQYVTRCDLFIMRSIAYRTLCSEGLVSRPIHLMMLVYQNAAVVSSWHLRLLLVNARLNSTYIGH